MLRITAMTNDDIAFAVSMTDYEDWGSSEADFRRLISLNSDGCFVAWEGDEKISMITTTIFDDFAFMGSLIVKDGLRRKGIGKKMMEHSISYLKSKNISSIELDATFQGAPLYRKLGFVDKYLSLRFHRTGRNDPAAKYEQPEYSMDEIVDFDRKAVGIDRSGIITRLAGEFEQSVYISRNGRLNGYAIVYVRGGNVASIGPLVAENDEIAAGLIESIIKVRGSQDIALGMPETAISIIPEFIRHGFFYREPSLRMYLGDRSDYESSVYAIASPDKG